MPFLLSLFFESCKQLKSTNISGTPIMYKTLFLVCWREWDMNYFLYRKCISRSLSHKIECENCYKWILIDIFSSISWTFIKQHFCFRCIANRYCWYQEELNPVLKEISSGEMAYKIIITFDNWIYSLNVQKEQRKGRWTLLEDAGL